MRRPTMTRPLTGRPVTKRPARYALAVTMVAGGAVALAACGSGGNGSASGSGTAAAAANTGSGIHVAKTSLGKVLVDPNGFTVYTFTADTMNKSTCDAACLHFWPLVKPEPAGMKATGVTGKLGSTQATSGDPIATINGMPIYTYSGDHSPGDVLGQNSNKFGGHWYAVSPAGQPIKTSGSGGSSGGSGGGGGYSY